jgi:hypothetical protein
MNEKYAADHYVFFTYTVTVPRFDGVKPAWSYDTAWKFELIWDGSATDMVVTLTRVNGAGQTYNTIVNRPFYMHG